MVVYLNTHVALEQMREKSEKEETRGPRVSRDCIITFDFLWLCISIVPVNINICILLYNIIHYTDFSI